MRSREDVQDQLDTLKDDLESLENELDLCQFNGTKKHSIQKEIREVTRKIKILEDQLVLIDLPRGQVS